MGNVIIINLSLDLLLYHFADCRLDYKQTVHIKTFISLVKFGYLHLFHQIQVILLFRPTCALLSHYTKSYFAIYTVVSLLLVILVLTLLYFTAKNNSAIYIVISILNIILLIIIFCSSRILMFISYALLPHFYFAMTH